MRFVAFDLETTGFLPDVDRIVEVGAVRFVNGEVEAVYSTLVDPQIPIPPGASRVNGITDDMVAGKPLIHDLLVSLADFCGDDLMVAHNASFDYGFLAADIKRHETRAPKGLILDTFPMAKKVLPGLANYKLGTLIQHLAIPAAGFHRAEADASYCGHLFLRMIEKMTGSKTALPDLQNLVTICGRGEMRFPQIIPQPKQLDLFSM
jgi:DNA polymerase-3 subunit epsilon